MKLSSLWLAGRRLCALVVLLVVLAGCIAPAQTRLTPQPSSTQKSTTGAATPSAAQLIIKTESGSVEGSSSDGVIAFKGIPYAAPPIGDLRWRAPQPVQPWTDVRKATAFGHDCMQMLNQDEPIQTTPSEDCLFVNVWQPGEHAQSSKLPVMVWIHGGGYVGGGSSIPYYDGSAFARQGMVVVSFNYRLGRFGFFAHPALLAAKEGQVGNFGYMDQIAALKWVQTNIAAFGGDPEQVTLVGESAGGASVLTLLTSPVTKGLFHRVMIMSGGGRQALITRQMTGGTAEHPSADQIDASFAKSLGIEGNGGDALAALRALPASAIVGDLNLESVLKAALLGTQIYPGTGMVDGVIVTEPPQAVFQRGGAANVPIIIGTTAVDLPLLFPPSKLDPFAYFGAEAEAARTAYNAPATLDQNSLSLLLLSIGTDMTMHEPARFVAKAMTAAGNPAWLYRFTYTAEATRPKAMGQAHAGELPFLFDTLAAKYGDKVTANDQQMAQAFNTYVGNFIKTGDPNGQNLPAWPKFDPAQVDLLNFTLANGPVFGPEPRPGVALVERAADQLTAASAPEKPAAAAQETTTMTTTSNAGASNKLSGTVWQWQKTQMSNDTSTTPDDPTRYTLAFLPDGNYQVQADCNRGRGVYTVDGNRLTLEKGMMTLMACPSGSLDATFLKQLNQTSGYLFSQGNLVLELKLDTGTMTFAPASTTALSGTTTMTATSGPTQATIFVLPDGLPCRWAGEGATLAFDGKRVNYTCSKSAEKIIALLGDPTPGAAGVWSVEKAIIKHDSNGFTLASREALTFLAAKLDLADGTQCAFAGQGATLAFAGKRLNYTCGKPGTEIVGIIGDLAIGEGGIITAEKVLIDRSGGGSTVKTSSSVVVKQINGAAVKSTVEETATMTDNQLMGVVWQWQGTQMGDGTTFKPNDPTKYTLTFLPEGRVQVQADCNKGSGVYKLDGQQLTLGPIAQTRMACLPDSLDTIFGKQLREVNAYLMDHGHLVLELKLDSGTMTFAPADPISSTGSTTVTATGSATLTGTVIYRQRIALLPGSVIAIQLQDVSKADAAAQMIASQTITTTGENVPIPFALAYEPAQIDPKHTYALSVRITTAGQLRWINTERYAVLTNGAPMGGVEVMVQPAR